MTDNQLKSYIILSIFRDKGFKNEGNKSDRSKIVPAGCPKKQNSCCSTEQTVRTAILTESSISEQSEQRTGRTVEIARNSSKSPNTEYIAETVKTVLIVYFERTVQTPKIIQNSEQVEQSEKFLFGFLLILRKKGIRVGI